MAYKVVHESENKIVSCRMYNAKAQISYRVNEWIEPRVGLVLVFGRLEFAKEFCRVYRSPADVIYRCQTRGLEKINLLLLSALDIDWFWEDLVFKGTNVSPNIILAPSGTYGATAVKLTKRLGNVRDLNIY